MCYDRLTTYRTFLRLLPFPPSLCRWRLPDPTSPRMQVSSTSFSYHVLFLLSLSLAPSLFFGSHGGTGILASAFQPNPAQRSSLNSLSRRPPLLCRAERFEDDGIVPRTRGAAYYEAKLAEKDAKILAVDEELTALRERRAGLVVERSSLASLFDEARFEVDKFSSWNGPILFTLFGAVATVGLWDYVRAISALYYYHEIEADWLPMSLALLTRVPADFLQSYGLLAGSTVVSTVLLTKALTSGVSYFFGDLVAQVFEGRRRLLLLDLPRTFRNAALGFALHGPVLHYWIACMEGPVAGFVGGNELPSTIFIKIALDQTLFAGFINYVYAGLDGKGESCPPHTPPYPQPCPYAAAHGALPASPQVCSPT